MILLYIYADSFEENKEKFNKLMERLSAANLKLQPDKCEFLRPEVAYLGHIIDKEGVRPDAVKNFPIPKKLKNIKQFSGLAGYYRRFIDEFGANCSNLESTFEEGCKICFRIIRHSGV